MKANNNHSYGKMGEGHRVSGAAFTAIAFGLALALTAPIAPIGQCAYADDGLKAASVSESFAEGAIDVSVDEKTGEGVEADEPEGNLVENAAANEGYTAIALPEAIEDSDAQEKPSFILEKSGLSTEKICINNCSVWLSQTKYTYDGRAKYPTVKASYRGRKLTRGISFSVSWLSDATTPGTKYVRVYGIGSYKGYRTLKYVVNMTANQMQMHRLYNPNSGEHFYTANTKERNSLSKAGWRYEGVAWIAPKSGTAVYRVYNPYSGDHHYTTSSSERDSLKRAGWRDEGIGWYSYRSQINPLYRLYNPNATSGAHHYTRNYAERNKLVKLGWRNEGVGWYGV